MITCTKKQHSKLTPFSILKMSDFLKKIGHFLTHFCNCKAVIFSEENMTALTTICLLEPTQQ